LVVEDVGNIIELPDECIGGFGGILLVFSGDIDDIIVSFLLSLSLEPF